MCSKKSRRFKSKRVQNDYGNVDVSVKNVMYVKKLCLDSFYM